MSIVALHDVENSRLNQVSVQVMPAKNVQQTVKAIRTFIQRNRRNPKVVDLARKIVKDIPGRDFDAIAERVYQYLIENMKYHRDPHMVEWIQDAEVSTLMKSGDCDDFTTLSGSLLQALGLRTRIIIAAVNGPKFNHVFSEYWSPGSRGWIPFDASVKKEVGWQSPRIVKRQAFLVD